MMCSFSRALVPLAGIMLVVVPLDAFLYMPQPQCRSSRSICARAGEVMPHRQPQHPGQLSKSRSASQPSCRDDHPRNPRPRRMRSLIRMQSAVVDTIEDAQSVILSAAENKDKDPDTVIDAIRLIEKNGGSKKALKGRGSQPKFDLLTDNGNWRLIFTTGDVKTQKKIGGKISYIPIKAVQVFNPDYTITNGVYLGSFPLLKFAGTFTWEEEKARLEFTFNQVGVLGLNFPYNQGESKVQPGFTFMDISDRYVIARGAGGGLALWLRQDTI